MWWAVSGNGISDTLVAFVLPLSSTSATITLVTTSAIAVSVFWCVLRHSRPSMYGFLAGLLLAIASIGLSKLVVANRLPFLELDSDQRLSVLQVLGITMLAGFVIVGLATFFGSLRAFFTFFTTVPIGGVWIGTAALVCVLSVMSGFESDLREKILGSNAHIQVTREDGEFVDWRAIKDADRSRSPGSSRRRRTRSARS